MGFEVLDLFGLEGIPDADGAVPTAGDEPAAAGRDRHARDPAFVAGHFQADDGGAGGRKSGRPRRWWQ